MRLWNCVIAPFLVLASLASGAEAKHRHQHQPSPDAIASLSSSAGPLAPTNTDPFFKDIWIGRTHVALWLPPTAEPAPLIIFSHGFGGCNTQMKFLSQGLAKAGYMVAAPNHRDAKCDHAFAHPEGAFVNPEGWTDTTWDTRRDDIKATWRGLRSDPTWKPRIDWSRIGLMGHSLGGYTVLGMAGGWKSWKMDGVAAIVAMTPYCAPLMANGTLENIIIPIMFQGGAADQFTTPNLKGANGCYEKVGGNATYVEFDKARQLAWSDDQDTAHEKILRYTSQYFSDAFAGAQHKYKKLPGVTELRQK